MARGGSKTAVQVTAHDVIGKAVGKQVRRAGFDGDEPNILDVIFYLNDGASITFEVDGRDGLVTYTPPQ
jgi:hypothetical protein